ncbi:MAG TPA: Trm112 family protein [Armatimonadota bacterium]|nr:Trm112 family protein [Armatimonadota bacterium]HQK94116.1 Trm112 family protein [Armatimonadota bacterium]
MISKELLEILVCPACRGELDYEPDVRLTCRSCGKSYPIRDGIPIMLVDGEGAEPQGGEGDA